MKKAVMYGAGNIGRGFLGKVFADSGYQVCFLDIIQTVIDAMNARHEYDVRIVSGGDIRIETVRGVFGVNASSSRAIDEIASCDIMSTAVGVRVLPRIAATIAEGIKKRMEYGGGKLDIILAENQIGADRLMRGYLYATLDKTQRAWADEHIGLVSSSIGRMVPPLKESERTADPLLIAVEEYAELPVDSLGFKGDIPPLLGLKPYTPFGFYIKRKLYLHNMGHAMCAYLGWRKGYRYIYECIGDASIYDTIERAMAEIVSALHMEYPAIPLREIEDHKTDLLHRFANRALLDTVFRVANDPIRKLRKDDRLTGAALYCLERGITPGFIILGIAAALRYDNDQDPSALELQLRLAENGLDDVFKAYMNIDPTDRLAGMIRDCFIA